MPMGFLSVLLVEVKALIESIEKSVDSSTQVPGRRVGQGLVRQPSGPPQDTQQRRV